MATEWGLSGRLARAARLGTAYEACLASMVEADGRASVQAGKAFPSERRIVLHAALLRPGREADRDATFLHECAHVLADLRYRRSCRHGPLWQATIVLLGEMPVAHHDIPYLSHAAHASVVWTCTSCGETYPFVRRPRRRIRDCYCRRCGPHRGRLVETAPEPAPA